MIKVISLTDAGQRLAETLHKQLPNSEAWHKPSPFTQKVQQAFKQGDRLIMICATGIVVRTLAPVLQDKYKDPAVLVLDEAGKFVIPLLSGHEGGANNWANEIASMLSAQLVITTAKTYLEPVYTIGMGCERGCSKEHLLSLLEACLQKAELDISLIQSISSIALKADEIGLIELAKELDKPYLTWQVDELKTVENQLHSRSDYVYKITGVYGVAESAALFAAQNNRESEAKLMLVKQKTAKATCAIAISR